MEIRISSNIETREKEVWLSDLPNDESLFDVINELRGEYKENKFIITEEINFSKNTINKEVNFSNCIFSNQVYFNDCLFINKINFEGSRFKNDFYFIANKTIDNTNFSKIIAHKEVSFFETVFKGNQNSFSNSTFMDNFYAGEIKVNQEINFSHTKFNGDAYFTSMRVNNFNFQNVKSLYLDNNQSNGNYLFRNEVNFNHSEFTKSNFSEAKFKTNVQFYSCKFYENINFDNTTFDKSCNFDECNFYKSQQFNSTNFFDRAIFSNAIFHKKIEFIHCKTYSQSIISFESAHFKQGLDISRNHFGNNISFWNVKIDNNEEQDVRISHTYKQIRETYRIIKNTFYKEDNRIEGLEFYKKEMAIYEKELKEKSFWHKDRIMLFLNKISNNYGTSWSRGVFFTVIMAFIFYICILISLHNSLEWNIYNLNAWDNFLKHFLEIINVAHWKDIKPFGIELNGLSYLFLFIGRIFIGYGYYQTIQAFRKYGKSS